jgi:hypothetical protein
MSWSQANVMAGLDPAAHAIVRECPAARTMA